MNNKPELSMALVANELPVSLGFLRKIRGRLGALLIGFSSTSLVACGGDPFEGKCIPNFSNKFCTEKEEECNPSDYKSDCYDNPDSGYVPQSIVTGGYDTDSSEDSDSTTGGGDYTFTIGDTEDSDDVDSTSSTGVDEHDGGIDTGSSSSGEHELGLNEF